MKKLLLFVSLFIVFCSCSSRQGYVSYSAWPIESELGCRKDCITRKISRGIPEQEAVATCSRRDVCKIPDYAQAIENTTREFVDNFREHR